MRKITASLISTLIVLLSVSAHAAGDEGASLDGRWRAHYTTAPDAVYEMEFTGDKFHAVSGDAWYKGDLVIDDEADPPRMDFVIRECECGREGQRSTGVFRWDGDSIELRAPQPGDPRPTEFDVKSGETMRLVREGEGGQP